MSIKANVQADFITAMKQKNETAKAALSGLKAKITVAEKDENRPNRNEELTDAEVLKIINKAIKEREDSAEIFTSANRPELAAREIGEMLILKCYVPPKMTEEVIEAAVRAIIPTLGGVPQNVLGGKTQGAFNKQFPGLADQAVLKIVINRVINP